jgi:cold shock CspA family protein
VTDTPEARRACGRVIRRSGAVGFIAPDGGGRQLFFHESEQLDDFDLLPGDRVRFEFQLPEPTKGPRALNVGWESTPSAEPS